MRNLYLFFALFTLAAFFAATEGKVFLQIDNFLQSQNPITVTVPAAAGGQAVDYWWTPYAYQAGRPPAASFRLTESAIGGQRDIVLGFEAFTPDNVVGIGAVASRRGTVAFDLDYVGGCYYQWDGIDHTLGDGIFRNSSVLPGALFNFQPGVGAHVNTTAFSERNSDGQTIDLTSAGAAVGIHINVITDHPCYYYIDLLNEVGVNNSISFVPDPSENTDGQDFFFRFDDAAWETYQGLPFDFRKVAGIQVRIWSFADQENPGGQTSQAIDTSFGQFWTYGYQITGVVQIDCQCDGTPESAAANVQVNIARTSASGTILATQSSDVNGNFVFAGNFLNENVTYQVCLVDTTQPRCASTPQCQTRTIGTNATDPAALTFRITFPSTIQAPSDITINCGDCSTTACLGNATISDCSGNLSPVPTFSDRTSGSCPTTITRTFSAGGLTAVQVITVVDTVAPVIVNPAQPVNSQCNGQGQTFNSWLASHANSTASDCSAITWTNDYTGTGVGACAATTVTFIATDACGNSDVTSRTTATYSVQDTTAPVFTTPPRDNSTQCNQNGSDFTALNNWVSTRGGGVATDNCGGVTYSNNFDENSVTRGCNSPIVVVFTATDGCNNVASASATFTILDTSPPSITTQARNQTSECVAGDNSAFNAWLSSHAGAVATDVCQGSNGLTWTNNFVGSAPAGCNANSGPVIFSVTDGCGTIATTTATFFVQDTTNPTLVTPASALNVDCSASDSSDLLNAWLNNQGGAVATDSCTGVTWTNNFNSSTTGSCASRPVTFIASDSCGHSVRTTATYSINDNTAPTITLGQPQLTVTCDSDTNAAFNAWLSSAAGASVIDNCASSDQITIRSNYTSSTPPQRGCLVNTYVAFTAVDPCGNVSPPQVGVFTIQDQTAPQITQVASPVSVECGASGSTTTSYQSFISTRGGAQANDSCSGVSWTNDAPATPAFDGCNGVTPVTFTARDACGLTATTSATYTVADTQPPTLTRPASNLNEECTNGNGQSSGLTSWLNNHGGSTATDACSAVTWTNNFVALSGGCNSSAVVQFTATDACGFSVQTSATYTVSDTRPPVITTPAQNLTVSCTTDTQSAILNWVNNNGGAVATDACTGSNSSLVWTRSLYDNVVGCSFATVTFTVTDPCGLSASTSATFTSVDTQAPTFNPAAQDLTVECDGNGNVNDYNSWVASHAGAVAQDSCAFSFTWTSNAPATGPTTCGSRPVAFTVTDNCNNRATTSATFTVQDSQPPVFSVLPSDLVVECGDSTQLQTWLNTQGGAVASDVCAATVTYTNTAGTPTGTDSCGQSRPYTFRASDSCGNTATATANYISRDNTPPTLTTPVADATFECDGNGNLQQIQQWVSSHGGAVARDTCTNNITWTNDYPGAGPLTCTTFQVTFTASDACGNSVSDSGALTITDTTNPTFSFFPQDYTVPCDADTSVETLGTATATDLCSGSLFVSMSETSFDEPAVGNCPGDHVITRTFSATDDCGNSVSRDQTITVQIVRSSGPCDPTGCECDSCCPPPVASDCLPADCEASACQRAPCTASACTCSNNNNDRLARDAIMGFQAEDDLIEPLPQCKPVYIYVNDDDDSEKDVDSTGLVKQRMLVTNQPLHESVLKNKSDASTLSFSLFAVLFALALFF